MTKLGRKFGLQLRESGIELDDDWVCDPVISLERGFTLSVQVFLYNDASARGILYFETSNDKENWHAIELGGDDSVVVDNDENIDELYNMGCLISGFFRLRYERTSGSGVMDLTALRKRS